MLTRIFAALSIHAAAFAAVSVTGRITANGQPVPGASVAILKDGTRHATTTGADGQYRFDGVEPGAWQCSVEMFSFAEVHAQLAVGEASAHSNFTLHPQAFDAAPASAQTPALRRPAFAGRPERGGRPQYRNRGGFAPGRREQGESGSEFQN